MMYAIGEARFGIQMMPRMENAKSNIPVAKHKIFKLVGFSTTYRFNSTAPDRAVSCALVSTLLAAPLAASRSISFLVLLRLTSLPTILLGPKADAPLFIYTYTQSPN